ncbi:MAG: hypothetical protein KDA41_15640, partial [Planctomycetales bacterium]|nr:hypothetical protein [Planctomycetales bacterium]
MLWALCHAAAQAGVQVQSFVPHAHFYDGDAAASLTGRTCRHLDPLLMPQAACRETLLQGSAGADLAIVAGDLSRPSSPAETLSQWLGLTHWAVVDAGQDPCRISAPPAHVDGVFLSGLC